MTQADSSPVEPADPAVADADPESVARQILLRRLTGQPRSRAELEQTLARRQVPVEVATALLDRFEEVGLVDDEAFARAWVQSRSTGKGLARRALQAELRRKGIADETTRTVLAELDPDDEAATARKLVERKLRTLRGQPPEVQLRRLVGLLGRKGYPPGLAYRVARSSLGVQSEGDDELP